MFLRRLRTEVDHYYEDSSVCTYEDLYSLASQLRDSESGEWDNPAIGSLVEKISGDLQWLCPRRDGEAHHADWSLLEIARETCHFIQDVVESSLSEEPSSLIHLDWLAEGAFDDDIESLPSQHSTTTLIWSS